MPNPSELLHERRFQAPWRTLLIALCAVSAWFAFSPGPPPGPEFEGIDKLHHLLAFGAMATVGCLGWPGSRFEILRLGLALLAYGGFIELVQSQLPTRTASWADLLTDAVGIGAGLLLAHGLRRRWPLRSD